jgi:thioredoxin reductase (NADPH)
VQREREELRVAMSDGSEATARAVVIATGVSYRRLAVPGLEELEGRSVFYGASVSEAAAVAGGDVFVVGGGNSAGQTALHLARHARAVTLLVRGPSLAQSMSSYLRDQIATAANVSVRNGTQVVAARGSELLKQLELKDVAGATELVRADALFVMTGGAPRTGNLPPEVGRDEKGYLITGSALLADAHSWPLERPPLMLETGMPGVFAVGDVRAGAPMRVASAVGDGSVVIQQVHQLLEEIEQNARSVHGV